MGARRAWLWRNKSLWTETQTRPPVLLVDVSAIIRHDAQTGIQRVVRAVWSELSKRDGDGFLVKPVYATNRQGYCYAPFDFLENRFLRLGGEPVNMGPGDQFLGLDLSAHLLPKYRQQLRAWRKFGGTISVVVYDLLPLQQPHWFNDATAGHFRRWIRLVAEDVDQAICISDQVARDLKRELGVDTPVQIGRLFMGGDISASRPSIGLSAAVKHALRTMNGRNAVLMVGTVEPRKGYEVALAAFEHLWRADPDNAPDLVIIGKSGWKTSKLQLAIRSHPELGKRLHWLDRVSDEGLCLFYEATRGLLVTSRGEGFGLPLIEAAAHRRRVLARDLAVFREQSLPNVMYFSDDRPVQLGERLNEFLRVSSETPTPAVHLSSWSECVDRLLVGLGWHKNECVAQEWRLKRAS